MTQEEKAKRYDEVAEKLRSLHDNYDTVSTLINIKEELEEILPELTESEDEKIRKAIISFLKSPFVNENITDEKVTPWIAWLEKQGEQKPVDKVEPKFKVGDTITDPTDSTFTFHINAIKDGKYMESDKDWVLIKEADSDYELVEQKPAWSEEDEMMLECTIDKISDLGTGEMCKEWLNSLRHQNRWKPSDEQMEALKIACDEHWEPDGLDPLYTLYQDLKKLK